MTQTNEIQKIAFKKFEIEDRAEYEALLFSDSERGCEFSFGNLYLWGRQKFAVIEGCAVIFSQFDRKTVYPFPVGPGDKKAAVDAIIGDAAARGISCRITGLSCENRNLLDSMYPGRFRFHCDEGSHDYVYSIDDLADLKGRKFHSKKNHVNKFRETYPDCRAVPLAEENIGAVRSLIEKWYADRTAENPESDFMMERAAIEKALHAYREIGMEALVLMNGGDALAVTFGSRLAHDTFDVHFEKAASGVQGAYAVINQEFAAYIREKYPDVKFLNREEDMGIEGLRKAKQSYHPHHRVAKCWAHLTEEGYEY